MAILRNVEINKKYDYSVGKRMHSVKEDETILQKFEELLNISSEPEANGESDWWTFYHFSELRKGVLSWYPFQERKKILEIGAECGALTGFFCEKSKWVTAIEADSRKAQIIYQRYEQLNNLEVISCAYDQLTNLDLNEKYDYIIINRVFEYLQDTNSFKSGAFLQQILRNFLQKEGKIILIADNRYGIRNFCGGRDAITGKPYDGINKYPNGVSGMTYSRNELAEGIENAGIQYYKFFYPLPDYRVTQLVYSDNYAMTNDIRNRIVFYEPNQETLLALQNNLYEDVIKNGALPFLSNSFLVECSLGNELTDIDYVTCSQDRGEEYSMITMISQNNTVVKRAIYDAGKVNLLKSVENLKELEARGIKVVESKVIDNSVVMPFIKEKTLSAHLIDSVEKQKDEFWRALELWYEDIVKSSGHVENQCNHLFAELSNEIRGIVLEKAYLDMGPMNCFVGKDGYVYFDQEFTEEYVPAKYVFFRGVKYLYQSHKWIENEIALEEVKRRYGLTESWGVYEQAEARFIARVRSVQQHESFYRWTKFNRKEIYNRVDLLEYQGEDVAGFNVSESTKIQQKVQLDLLDKFNQICKRYNLRFFMIYGSLLGTVRHKGFIPWDDDIDVAMPREDYDKLLKIAEDVFEYPYFLQTPENDTDVFYGGYSKLRNSATTGMEPRNWKHNCNQGIWLDVFPLDKCYDNEQKNNELWSKIHDCQQMLFVSIYRRKIAEWQLSDQEWEALRNEALKYPKEHWYAMLGGLLRQCETIESPYLAIKARYMAAHPRMFWAEDFSDCIMMDFEGLKVPVPVGYQRCLEMTNGKRYMIYPQSDYRVPHHRGLFSAEVPFSKYMEHFNVDYTVEKAYLLGESEVIQYFYNRYKNRIKQIYWIRDLVDKTDGLVEISAVSSAILKENLGSSLIICAKKFEKFEKVLQKESINNYKIFFTSPQHLIQKK